MEFEYQENKIKMLLTEMSSIFFDLDLREEIRSSNPEDYSLHDDITELENRFKYLSDRVFKLCLVYFEEKSLFDYLKRFKEELSQILSDPKKILSGSFDPESVEVSSDLLSLFWNYLLPFEAFSENDYKLLLKRSGLYYLEKILESTAVICEAINIIPTTETQVYNAVKIVTSATFPNSIFPSQSFQKQAKCYIPDILIPSLNCAVEYKYAAREGKLIDTIDQILIDVKGYDNHPTYKLFFAVFYVKAGIWTKERFDTVWSEKEFPENWKGFFVIGK